MNKTYSKIMEDLLSMGLGGLKLDDFPSAKLKVDQLFQQWLLLEGKVCISSLIRPIIHSFIINIAGYRRLIV